MSDQRFNTGNPIGSNSPLDRSDNTRNLDVAVNAEQLTWVDRLGRDRKSFEGMESEFDADQADRVAEFDADQTSREQQFRTFIASSGYQFAGDYAAGIEITQYNQLIRDENGEFWRVSGQVDLPYVTTGDGIPEGDALVSAGDAVLRQDLANPDKGAAMVARGVVAVDSIADLLALPEGQRRGDLRYLVQGYYAGSDVGGGILTWDSSRSAEDDGFSVLSGWVRVLGSTVTPEMAGAKGDATHDDGPALRAAVGYLNDIGGGNLQCRGGAVYACSIADLGTTRSSVIHPVNGVSVYLNGATIQTNDSVTKFNYNIVDWTGSVNCTVEGGTLKGNKYLESASSGEWGMGLGLYGSVNCHARNLYILEQGGDGIYLGRNGAVLSYSENCSFENIVCDDNRRQGISLISGKNLSFRNIVCSNTNGTNPRDGIDVEPNNPDEFLQNIIFDNVETFNNAGSGVKFDLFNLNSTSESISVSFTNYKSSNEDPLRFRRGRDGMRGGITFSGTTTLINSGVRYDDFENIDVTIDDLIINNPIGGGRSGLPVYIGMGNDASSTGTEKLTIKRLRCYGVYDRAIYIRGLNQPFIRDIDIHVNHIDDAQVSNSEIMIDSAEYSGINITADVKDFSKNAGHSYTYSPGRHSPNFMSQGGLASPFEMSGLRPGSTITIINNNTFGSSDVWSSVSCGSGNYFTPGTVRDSDPGSNLLNLTSRGSWVTVERMTDNPSEFRIVDGNGYAVRAP